MERLGKVIKASYEGMKSGLTAGVSIGAIWNGLPIKWMRKSSILEKIAQPDEKTGNDTIRIFGFSVLVAGATGAVIGAFKGMFGKDKPEQEMGDAEQAVDKAGKTLPLAHEPLRSPDAEQNAGQAKAHSAGMEPQTLHGMKEPATSHVAAEESRPKEAAMAR